MPSPLHNLYKTARWQRIRRHQLLIRPLCQICAQQGRTTPADTVDHIKPHNGDVNAFWLNPLQSLCKSCHDAGKRFEDLNGYRREIGVDGWPVDERHPSNRDR
jgi:5-methylcytosine-specific restriction endonuclease McrA